MNCISLLPMRDVIFPPQVKPHVCGMPLIISTEGSRLRVVRVGRISTVVVVSCFRLRVFG